MSTVTKNIADHNPDDRPEEQPREDRLFELGTVTMMGTITWDALERLGDPKVLIADLVARHGRLDPGVLSPEDQEANRAAIRAAEEGVDQDDRAGIVSVYTIGSGFRYETFYVMTIEDWSGTPNTTVKVHDTSYLHESEDADDDEED